VNTFLQPSGSSLIAPAKCSRAPLQGNYDSKLHELVRTKLNIVIKITNLFTAYDNHQAPELIPDCYS
jgi:hypothetical protein